MAARATVETRKATSHLHEELNRLYGAVANTYQERGVYFTKPVVKRNVVLGAVHVSDLNPYRIEVINGKLYQGGEPFDTVPSVRWGLYPQAIYVMDGAGNFYASTKRVRGEFHHTSFFGPIPVAAAGAIICVKGEIKAINNSSGHYLPGPKHLMQALHRLRALGVSEAFEFSLDRGRQDFRTFALEEVIAGVPVPRWFGNPGVFENVAFE